MIDRAIIVITLELFLAVCLEMVVTMPKYKNIFSKQEIHCSCWHVADKLVINVNYTPQTPPFQGLFSSRKPCFDR